jgi:hypothetical protein
VTPLHDFVSTLLSSDSFEMTYETSAGLLTGIHSTARGSLDPAEPADPPLAAPPLDPPEPPGFD